MTVTVIKVTQVLMSNQLTIHESFFCLGVPRQIKRIRSKEKKTSIL